MDYVLQRCRSHETNNSPQAWEPLVTGNEGHIVREYFRRCASRGASGDQFRIVDAADGAEQCILSPTTCGPMH